jgi:hypothetical protein
MRQFKTYHEAEILTHLSGSLSQYGQAVVRLSLKAGRVESNFFTSPSALPAPFLRQPSKGGLCKLN